jgi:hypothetical protein
MEMFNNQGIITDIKGTPQYRDGEKPENAFSQLLNAKLL